jgi:hypothetical protein
VAQSGEVNTAYGGMSEVHIRSDPLRRAGGRADAVLYCGSAMR